MQIVNVSSFSDELFSVANDKYKYEVPLPASGCGRPYSNMICIKIRCTTI